LGVLGVRIYALSGKFGGLVVTNTWQARLSELLEENNAVHNTNNNLHARGEDEGNGPEQNEKTPKNGTPKTPKTPSEASERGLVATWAATFGFVSIHDPLTYEWHDIQTKQAPRWALAEASARKTLYKSGDHKAYSYNARKMEEIWGTEHPSPEESIEHPSPEEGIVEEYGIEAEDQYE
jgi:hypothetical protein